MFSLSTDALYGLTILSFLRWISSFLFYKRFEFTLKMKSASFRFGGDLKEDDEDFSIKLVGEGSLFLYLSIL